MRHERLSSHVKACQCCSLHARCTLHAARCTLHTGADLLPGVASTSASTASAPPQPDTASSTTPAKQQRRRKASLSCSPGRKAAAVEYAAIVTIPPGVVPGQAMQVQMADGSCVVVQVRAAKRATFAACRDSSAVLPVLYTD
jgi:hypothetical protein